MSNPVKRCKNKRVALYRYVYVSYICIYIYTHTSAFLYLESNCMPWNSKLKSATPVAASRARALAAGRSWPGQSQSKVKAAVTTQVWGMFAIYDTIATLGIWCHTYVYVHICLCISAQIWLPAQAEVYLVYLMLKLAGLGIITLVTMEVPTAWSLSSWAEILGLVRIWLRSHGQTKRSW